MAVPYCRREKRLPKDVLVARLGFQAGFKSQHDQIIRFLSVLSYHTRKISVAPQTRYRVPSLWDYHHKIPMSSLETTLRETTHKFTNKQAGYQQGNIKKSPFSTHCGHQCCTHSAITFHPFALLTLSPPTRLTPCI